MKQIQFSLFESFKSNNIDSPQTSFYFNSDNVKSSDENEEISDKMKILYETDFLGFLKIHSKMNVLKESKQTSINFEDSLVYRNIPKDIKKRKKNSGRTVILETIEIDKNYNLGENEMLLNKRVNREQNRDNDFFYENERKSSMSKTSEKSKEKTVKNNITFSQSKESHATFSKEVLKSKNLSEETTTLDSLNSKLKYNVKNLVEKQKIQCSRDNFFEDCTLKKPSIVNIPISNEKQMKNFTSNNEITENIFNRRHELKANNNQTFSKIIKNELINSSLSHCMELGENIEINFGEGYKNKVIENLREKVISRESLYFSLYDFEKSNCFDKEKIRQNFYKKDNYKISLINKIFPNFNNKDDYLKKYPFKSIENIIKMKKGFHDIILEDFKEQSQIQSVLSDFEIFKLFKSLIITDKKDDSEKSTFFNQFIDTFKKIKAEIKIIKIDLIENSGSNSSSFLESNLQIHKKLLNYYIDKNFMNSLEIPFLEFDFSKQLFISKYLYIKELKILLKEIKNLQKEKHHFLKVLGI